MTEQNADKETINALQAKVDAIIQDKPAETPTKPKKPRKDSITLNKREKAYVFHRARGNTIYQSMIKAGYKERNRSKLDSLGSHMEDKVKIKEALEIEKVNIFDIKTITADYVLDGIKKIAENPSKEANGLRAWELLGKYRELALFTDNLKITSTDEDKEFRLERLQALENNRVKAHQEN